ncbi:unnamed protein product [Oikopleura dioica]|uniref:Uncharacterized protein n=1 Tax=Oikopleura dioica TaxID=34765 RepID=E4WUG3_OIKDI|nr:unnamed protein product [Oikopleura dioica]CBY33287.1 unnamed protein product [Oikopleura dioica]
MGSSSDSEDIISYAETSQPKEIPWTLFLSSDRRMMRNLSRELSQKISSQNSPPQEDWSQYLNKKYDGFVQLCKDYPMGSFLGSNRQMMRRVTTRIAYSSESSSASSSASNSSDDRN